MSPERADLLNRITSFDIDGGEVVLPFAARLARENGWSRTYADRVVVEYKRFVFLAVSGTQSPPSSGSSQAQSARDGGRAVCPSEDVDAAWHLHLTYTRSYWGHFCHETLGRPLHHDPTKGGPSEGTKHLAMYAHTIAAYREAFGEEPPTDIWPSAERRFGDDTRHRAVNVVRNWVIPKAPVKRVAVLAVGFAVVAVLVPGCDGGPNPYTLKNKDFLAVLMFAMIGALITGRVLRSVLRKPNPRPEDAERQLDWEQTAYLVGGAERLTTAALARLFGRGLARVGDDGKTLLPAASVESEMTAVERAALKALPLTNEPAALQPVQSAVGAAFATRADALQRDGLTLSAQGQTGIAMAALIPPALVLLGLAVPRLLMGLANKHPVGYLVAILVIGSFVTLLVVFAGSLRLSNRGRAILVQQKERHRALRTGAQWPEHGDEAGMAVALFGTAALAGSMAAPLQTWYPRQTSEASSSGCGSSGCGTSDSGGGDGGSGCGGGCGGGGD